MTIIKSDVEINYCKSFLTENLSITKSIDDNQLLNKKSELVITCRHKNKLLLKTLKINCKIIQ